MSNVADRPLASELPHGGSAWTRRPDDPARRLQAIVGSGQLSNLEIVSEVIVLASSSRGGSSVLAETLRACPRLISLQGEITPLLRAAGITRHDSPTHSDELLDCSDEQARRVEAQLRFDISGPRGHLGDPSVFELLTDRLVWRLTAQWPSAEFSREAIRHAMDLALRRLGKGLDASAWSLDDLRSFHLGVLDGLIDAGYPVDPRLYDLQRGSAGLPRIEQGLIEEPPFITIWPATPIAWDVLATKPLVIKSPSSAFRIGLLRRLFPCARIRLLHLVRNPQASVAGLVDGWLHAGFHSHYLPGCLSIEGYSDVLPPEAGANDWWKFDLPPGWEEYRNRHLTDVAAFQWEQAHRYILRDCRAACSDYIRVRFEDLLECSGSTEATDRLGRWLGLEHPQSLSRALRNLPLVMATRGTQRRKTRRHSDRIEGLRHSPGLVELGDRFGYRHG